MKLIIDSGSTKSDWTLILPDTSLRTFETMGFNPFFHSTDTIFKTIQSRSEIISIAPSITQIYYYGAGCSSIQNNLIVENAFRKVFTHASIEVHHDLLASARAVYQGKPVIAGILGTGSNTCYYDGEKTSQLKPSLGYILGDEGSGGYFGKKLLTDYLYHQLPSDLHQAFEQQFPHRKEDILQRIYKEPSANTFIASFSVFYSAHRAHPYVQETLLTGFTHYLQTHICVYPNYQQLNVGFIGSMAFHFEQELKKAAENLGITVQTILQKPMEGLVLFHLT
jgi:glucosamine kinase